ncbi:PucR family transcriptional regulator [Sporomusa acidovorans]|uniref:Purine catabolism regulatory protein n=1 Tax=Sporomusa acidovorans (strain ATCC 49682 / DSM 3132 / Mol) TaxID=1123286 RepID=A0ABZ3JBL2_SPOA4|nr:PucR family transcriptional regulator [Sporomusa acidovorans]OZC18591.1 purine catabolism regulatory protein [Sporomusa acidovorans DSM 3132]SDF52378.1 DNA-binding transcriptional regulator, PucR family [Sporomusa acidovorans]
MEATVENILKLPEFGGSKIVSGFQGSKNIVRCIDVMEMHKDLGRWVREGEVLLTCAFSTQKDAAALCQLIQEMSQAKCAALALKVERFLGTIPAEMIKLSNELGLPVIDLVTDNPYMEVAAAVNNFIMNYQQEKLKWSVSIHKELSKLVLANRGLQDIVDSISTIGDCYVVIQDAWGRLLAEAGKRGSFRQIRKTLPITFDQTEIGIVSLYKDAEKIGELDAVILEHAATVAALQLFKQRVLSETEYRSRADFIYDLIAGNIVDKELIFSRSRFLKIEPESAWGLVVAEFTGSGKCGRPLGEAEIEAIKTELLKIAIATFEKNAINTVRNDKLIILFPVVYTNDKQESEKTACMLAQSLHSGISTALPSIIATVGIGNICQSLQEIRKSFDQAVKAIRIGGAIFGQNRVISINDLGIFQLLSPMKDQPDLRAVISRWIGTVIDYDREKGTSLLDTLEVYLDTNRNMLATAKRLFIHRNTLRYRIDKLKKLLGTTLDNPENHLQILMSVKLWKITR